MGGVAVAAAVADRAGGGRRGRAPARASRRTAALRRGGGAAGIDHRYDGDFQYFVGGGVAAFDCDDDGLPDLYLAGGAEPAALYRNDSPIGGALRFSALAEPGHRPRRGHRRLPARHRRRRHHRPRGAAGRRERRSCAASATAGSSAPTRRWGFDGGDGWTTAFSATWEGDERAADAGLRQLPRARRDRRRDLDCADNELVRPDADGTRLRRADRRSRPGCCTLSMLFSDWDRSGRARPAGQQRPPLLHATAARSSSGGSTPGEPPRLYTAADGWSRCRSRAWASPARTSPATATRRST